MPTRSNSFGDTEFYQVKQEIKKRFDKILIALQKTVEKNGYAVVTVQRFRDCLKNPEDNNVSRLPYYSNTPFATAHNKVECVLSIISFIAQRYWMFCGKNKLYEDHIKSSIDVHLDWLENIAARGLKAFKLAKSHSPRGYYLEEIK